MLTTHTHQEFTDYLLPDSQTIRDFFREDDPSDATVDTLYGAHRWETFTAEIGQSIL